MGLFASNKERHRLLLAEASRLLESFTRWGTSTSRPSPSNFTLPCGKLEKLVSTRSTPKLRTRRREYMRELAEDLVRQLIVTGKYSKGDPTQLPDGAFENPLSPSPTLSDDLSFERATVARACWAMPDRAWRR